jgi:predicted O-methyltransferase YrrM
MHPDWQNLTHLYCEKNSSPEPEILKKLSDYTWKTTVNPRQLSGHLQGRFLAQWIQLLRPLNIVEIGTFTGYATYCLWEFALPEATITTIEADKETAFKCKHFWQNEKQHPNVHWVVDDASAVIPKMKNIDFLFVDADKHNYKKYFDLALPKLSTHGIMLFDNTLWSGKLVEGAKDKDSQNMDEFNQYLRGNDSINVTLLPLRDGLTLVSKRN